MSTPKGLVAAALAGLLAMTACQAEQPTPTSTTAAPAPTATRPPATPTQAAAPTQAAVPTPAATAAPSPTVAAATATAAGPALAPGAIVVKVFPVGGSGQGGTVTLTPKGAQTEVVINVAPGAIGVAQPTHFHDTECQSPPKVIHRLTNVMDGKSTTTLNASIADLQKQPLAFCLHKSGPESAIYTAAGVLPPETKGFAVGIADLRHPAMTVPAGTTVAWLNADSVAHTVTSGTNGQPDAKWDSPELAPGRVFRFTFSQVGTFTYTCKIHPSMNATVKVTEGGEPSTSTPTTSSSDPYNY